VAHLKQCKYCSCVFKSISKHCKVCDTCKKKNHIIAVNKRLNNLGSSLAQKGDRLDKISDLNEEIKENPFSFIRM
jgi:hypothetical protein